MRFFLYNESIEWTFSPVVALLMPMVFVITKCLLCTLIAYFVTEFLRLIFTYYRSLSIDPKGRAVVITGCDTGFGHSLAEKLHALEFTVFACCLDKESQGAQSLQSQGDETGRLRVVELDVTNQNSVDKARHYVETHLPEGGLWSVVNNAGIAHTASYLEWLETKEFEMLASVNLFGVIRVTKSFLPLIRKSQGRVVNVSSILGIVPTLYSGAYCITKSGIEAYSDVLRLEMRPFNVSVSIIQPGNFMKATNIVFGEEKYPNSQSWPMLDQTIKSDYGEDCLERMIQLGKATVNMSATDSSVVVKAMANAVYRKHPKTRYFEASFTEKTFTFFIRVLPTCVSDPVRFLVAVLIIYLYN